MKSMLAFAKKEWTGQARSGQLMILSIIFILLGIMNPAIAKLTPWLLEMMADALAESGVIVTAVAVDAMDSWMQFFKNVPLGLLAFLLIESSVFTSEYQSGTLVLAVTKGLDRYKILVSKSALLVALWTAGYWLSFYITYGYNAYYWDNGVAQNLVFSVVCWWLFGFLTVALTVLFSTIARSNTGVLIGVGAAVLALYVISLFPETMTFSPLFLTDGNALIYGTVSASIYTTALVSTIVLSALCFGISVPIFNRKQI